MEKVFVGIPSFDGRVHQDIVGAMLTATTKNRMAHFMTSSYSCLPYNFNVLFAAALNARKTHGITHFVMLHADVVPEAGWLDKIVDLANTHQADVLSVIIPIKNNKGITSTAFDVYPPENGFNATARPKRLTMHEAFTKHPPTFTDDKLVVNTGCMIIDLRKDWVENACFKFQDWFSKIDGVISPVNIPEDWMFSREAKLAGAKLFATREISVKHFGSMFFPNTSGWGTVQEDATNV